MILLFPQFKTFLVIAAGVAIAMLGVWGVAFVALGAVDEPATTAGLVTLVITVWCSACWSCVRWHFHTLAEADRKFAAHFGPLVYGDPESGAYCLLLNRICLGPGNQVGFYFHESEDCSKFTMALSEVPAFISGLLVPFPHSTEYESSPASWWDEVLLRLQIAWQSSWLARLLTSDRREPK